MAGEGGVVTCLTACLHGGTRSDMRGSGQHRTHRTPEPLSFLSFPFFAG